MLWFFLLNGAPKLSLKVFGSNKYLGLQNGSFLFEVLEKEV
jgi:hypothetical protein